MAPFGVMQIHRVALREDSTADLSLTDFGTAMEVGGQESVVRLSMIQVKARVDDVLALAGRMVPATFSNKPELNGFYRVEDVSAKYEKWMPEDKGILPWKLTLTRVGFGGDTDMESRLSGPVTRANDHAATGERWHAPPPAATAYSAGSAALLSVARASVDGTTTVYRALGSTVNPRWGITAAAALAGRCRFIDSNAQERTTTTAELAATGWEVHNGIVKVSVDAGTGLLNISAWTGGAWQSKMWEVFHSTGPAITLGVPDYCSILRNDLECVSVRLTKALSGGGRVTMDLTVRRGGRLVEIYLQHQLGTTLKIVRSAAEAATASTGYLVATAADGAGNKYIIGSSRTFTNDVANGGISKAATPVLDAFIGVVVTAAAAGDTAADLFKHYLGAPTETVAGVRR